MALALGQHLEVEPEILVAGGDALARVDGFPLFIRALYPGDRASVRITELRKGFGRAEAVEIIRLSRDRRAEPCPVARECGGCDWTELRLDRQIHWKRRILLDSLRRIGKFDPASLPSPAVHVSPLRYRLRSRLQVRTDEDGAIGFYAARSNRVVPLPEECEVVGPGVIAHLDELRRAAEQIRPPAIEVLEGTREVVAHLGDGEPPATTVRAGDWELRLTPVSFFQVNRHLLGTLHRLVTDSARKCRRRELAWDLYGGVGFFALPLAEHFARVITVESSPESHRWAVRNVRSLEAIEPVRDEVGRFLERERAGADFILVDPPRAGLAPEVTERIAEGGAERICYLSCDPVTFSRDAHRLARRGWALASLDLIDLFPNTHHIETLASFVLAG
ncbi:MAG TPA: TRAM domain-containing protein [Thermoanaerobaculia bacterium]|nr:TRAM domain-containing protein [Thermoanaerobaculia bacterium]